MKDKNYVICDCCGDTIDDIVEQFKELRTGTLSSIHHSISEYRLENICKWLREQLVKAYEQGIKRGDKNG